MSSPAVLIMNEGDSPIIAGVIERTTNCDPVNSLTNRFLYCECLCCAAKMEELLEKFEARVSALIEEKFSAALEGVTRDQVDFKKALQALFTMQLRPTTSSVKSSAYRKPAIAAYRVNEHNGAVRADGGLLCMVSDRYFPADQVKAGHIIRSEWAPLAVSVWKVVQEAGYAGMHSKHQGQEPTKPLDTGNLPLSLFTLICCCFPCQIFLRCPKQHHECSENFRMASSLILLLAYFAPK